MTATPEVLALIPAESGSSHVPDKDIRPFRGKPLFAHSILQALAAETVCRVVVSTDNSEYANLARAFGAEVPFLRPRELAADRTAVHEVFRHALRWLDDHEGYRPEICVELIPTFPHRSPADIDRAVRMLIDHREADSVRSVSALPHDPRARWFRDEGGFLRAVDLAAGGPHSHGSTRNPSVSTWIENGVVNAVRGEVVLRGNSMTGDHTLGYQMEPLRAIEDWIDFELVQRDILRDGELPSGLVFVFDLDGVIAKLVPENRYEESSPDQEMITIVNRLHEAGNRIVVHTARGTVTGIDWRALTERQLRAWGLRYHELQFGKPAGDYYVDDRSLAPGSLLSRPRVAK